MKKEMADLEWWQKRCRENPGLGDTPEEQIAYFRELGHNEYADRLQNLLIDVSDRPLAPEGSHKGTE